MSRTKTHYNEALTEPGIVTVNRVSRCGAITVHSTPQTFVRETNDLSKVDCKNCRRREDSRR